MLAKRLTSLTRAPSLRIADFWCVPVLLTLALLCASAQAQTPSLKDIRGLVDRGELDAALESVQRYLASGANEQQGRFLQGVILTGQQRTDEAIEVFEALVRDHQDLPEPHNNLAVLYASRGDLDRARDALLQAIAIHPSYAIAHENLGDIYTRMAEIAYQRATELDDGNLTARNKLALLRDVTHLAVGATPAPAPGASPAASTSAVPAVAATASRGVLLAAVQAWAGHWSGQDVEAYLGSYADDFVAPSGRSRAAWAAERRRRIASPRSISVAIDDFKVERASDRSARVSFTQTYTSETYRDRVGKRLDLVRDGEQWKIRRETSLGLR
jgi:tetratricopeptide (TPR) repeat protein